MFAPASRGTTWVEKSGAKPPPMQYRQTIGDKRSVTDGECVGEKVVKFGVRNGEIRVRGMPVSGTEGHQADCLRTGKDLSSCELLAEKCS
jgi:hypothetical protein